MKNEPKFVYLLSRDGHRDSVELMTCALTIQGLIEILSDDEKDLYESTVLKETVTVHEKENEFFLSYQYKDFWGAIQSGKCGFFKVKIV